MRKLFLGILMLFPLLGYAELKATEKFDVTMYCYDTDKLFAELKKEFDERPFLLGQTNDVASSTMSFWMSKKGDTWTIVASTRDISCIVGTGLNLILLKTGKTI